MSAFLKSIKRGLSTLTFPESCIGCASPDARICRECSLTLAPSPRLISRNPIPIVASLTYDSIAARVVLAAKEDGHRNSQELLTTAIRSSVCNLISRVGTLDNAAIVPVPSSSAAVRRRGRDFLALIAQDLTTSLSAEIGTRLVHRNLLRVRRRVADQSGLDAAERSKNLSGAFEAIGEVSIDNPIILIDDVITTGSTIREAIRALQERNLAIFGAATACASQRRMPIR